MHDLSRAKNLRSRNLPDLFRFPIKNKNKLREQFYYTFYNLRIVSVLK